MSDSSINHTTFARLVEAGAVRGVSVVGVPGGWGVSVRYGMMERPLAARRGDVRVWRRLDSVVRYLREQGVARFEVDAAQFDPQSVAEARRRPDRAEALKRTHEAAAHDQWFREQVEQALAEADQPAVVWHDWQEVKQDLKARHADNTAGRRR